MTSDLSHISLDLNSEAMVPGAKPLDTRELRENAIFVWHLHCFQGPKPHLGIQKPTVFMGSTLQLRGHNLLFCRVWGHR